MIRYRCPDCSVLLESPDDLAGQTRKCPKCGRSLTLPVPPSLPAPAQLVEHVPDAPPVLPVSALAPPTALVVGQAAPSGPTLQCWQCGQLFPAEQVQRRNVLTGGSVGAALFTGGKAAGAAGHVGRVDLCPKCAARHDAKVKRFWDWYKIAWLALAAALVLYGVCGLLFGYLSFSSKP